jgi:phosphatidylglycerophosphatase A
MQAGGIMRMNQKLALWVAQGFGSGRIPVAPGTFGSVLGLVWYGLLLWSGNWFVFVGGALVLTMAAVPLCGTAEKMLGAKDPGSVVLDEIVALPFCFGAWTAIYSRAHEGLLPAPGWFFAGKHWISAGTIFVLFRLCDVLKPWPARQSQQLPGGWGVVVDDLFAALYVNLIVIAGWWWFGMFSF